MKALIAGSRQEKQSVGHSHGDIAGIIKRVARRRDHIVKAQAESNAFSPMLGSTGGGELQPFFPPLIRHPVSIGYSASKIHTLGHAMALTTVHGTLVASRSGVVAPRPDVLVRCWHVAEPVQRAFQDYLRREQAQTALEARKHDDPGVYLAKVRWKG